MGGRGAKKKKPHEPAAGLGPAMGSAWEGGSDAWRQDVGTQDLELLARFSWTWRRTWLSSVLCPIHRCSQLAWTPWDPSSWVWASLALLLLLLVRGECS